MTDLKDMYSSDTGRFSAPWHAQLVALSLALYDAEIFIWSEFSEKLGDMLASTPTDSSRSEDDHYYHCYLDALVALLKDKQHLDQQQCDVMTERWRQAYLNTAHGKPVKI